MMNNLIERYNVYSSTFVRRVVFVLFLTASFILNAQIYSTNADNIHIIGDAKIYEGKSDVASKDQLKQSKSNDLYIADGAIVYDASNSISVNSVKTTVKERSKTSTEEHKIVAQAKKKVHVEKPKKELPQESAILFCRDSRESFVSTMSSSKVSVVVPTSNISLKAIVTAYRSVFTLPNKDNVLPFFTGKQFFFSNNFHQYYSVRPPPFS